MTHMGGWSHLHEVIQMYTHVLIDMCLNKVNKILCFTDKMISWWKEGLWDDDILHVYTFIGIVHVCRASRSQRTALSFHRVSGSVSDDGAQILRPCSPASSEPNVPVDLAVGAEGTELHRGLPKHSPCMRSFEIHRLGCAERSAPGSQACGGTAGAALAPRVPLCEEGTWKHTDGFPTAKPLPCTQRVHHGAPGERDCSAEGGDEVVLCRGVLDPGHSPGLKPPPAAPRHSPWPRGPLPYTSADPGLSPRCPPSLLSF